MKTYAIAAGVAALFGGAGCGIGGLGKAAAPAAHPAGSVQAAGMRPLLVDWGPNDRTLLNTSRTTGPLVVRYHDGTLEPLFSCRAKGTYAYTSERSVQVQDDIIETADELRAKMPAFGAKFEGNLARDGKLHVRMMVVGTYASDQPYFKAADLIGDCADATHVASHVTVGAFRLFALSRGELQGDVAIAGAEAGGGSRASEQNLNAGGDEAACAKATAEDGQPPDGCSTSLQLVLAPLMNGEPPPATAPRDKPGWNAQKTAALVVGGAGVLGTGIGLILGASASSKWSQAKSDCGAGCAPDSVAEHEKSDAQHAATLATVVVGVGAAALVTGAVLWLTAPDGVPARRTARIGVTPSANPGGAGARLYGEF